jgi:phosphatidate cytidylyltransferase
MDRKALALRLGSAAVLVPVVLGIIWLGGWWFVAMMVVAGWIMAYEWNRMCGGKIDAVLAVYAVILYAIGYFGASIGIVAAGLALAVGLVATLAAAALSRRNIVWALTGLVYIALPVGALIWLRGLPLYGFDLVLWVFLVVWATDSAAFFVGKTAGGPRLAPTVSPNKTWSGAIGGLVGASLVGLGFALVAGLPIAVAMIASAFVGLWAELGDLQESWFKRRLQIKDSGSLIPGHGGLLDRLDSLLFAGPIVCLMVVLPSRPWLPL